MSAIFTGMIVLLLLPGALVICGLAGLSIYHCVIDRGNQ